MYAGFITSKRVVKRAGIHQRFDTAAYRLIEPLLEEAQFPDLKDILHFEGYNGPDGLNAKGGKLKPKGLMSPDEHEHNPSHLYDPETDTGEVPEHIAGHYAALVKNLKAGDEIRAGFEASWMAHYIADGLTPAHHFPLEEKVAQAAEKASADLKSGDTGKFAASVKKNWAIWGAKGHMSTHFNFEMGIAFALLIFPIRPAFSEAEVVRARELGAVEYFKAEAREIASLKLYDEFYRHGWTAEIAGVVKNHLAPHAARTIGIIWLLAVIESGQKLPLTAVDVTPEPA